MSEALAVLFFVLCVTTATPAAAKKVWSTSPDEGFIDDAMAFSGSSLFAYIQSDAAKFLDLYLLDLSTLKQRLKISIDQPMRVPKRLLFTPDGSKLLLIWMDGYSGKHGAMLFDVATGKQLKEIKAGAEFAQVVLRDGEQLLTLGSTRADKRGNQQLSLDVHRTADLRKTKTVRLSIGADRVLKQPPVRLLYFEPGHLTLIGMTRGDYDKKRDIRLPDRAVRYDLLLRKIVWSEEPKELVKWTQATNMRPGHSGQYRFVQVSEDLGKLHYVDRDNGVAGLTTPVNWKLYDAKSLAQAETWDGQTLYFSMTVDPVNPAAVARKKADQERCDLYRLDPGPRARPLGQVLTDKRRFGWIVGASHFAYLRKLKGFGRGGKTVELHPLQ